MEVAEEEAEVAVEEVQVVEEVVKEVGEEENDFPKLELTLIFILSLYLLRLLYLM